MIKPSEIQQLANADSVRDRQIEKDYVLSWILQGIAAHEQLSELLIFKGGTVLKKVYFEDYRYSEDLDFTISNDTITNEEIFKYFKISFNYVLEETNIPLDITDNNEHQDKGINFYISYVGPLGGQGGNKRIKIDISRDERLAFEPIRQDIILRYSDQMPHQLLCYLLEEVLVEKMRSVIQRMQARDFYDIWYLLEIHGMDATFYLNEFKTKCDAKNIDYRQFTAKLEQRKASYKARWQRSMADQIRDLADFDRVDREVQRHIRKLNF